MHCFCQEDEEIIYLKIEGDFGADAIWCDDCSSNLDIEEIPISQPLKEKLVQWARQYGSWMDWENNVMYTNGIQMEEEHNKLGQLLTEKVQEELGFKYKVCFSSSTLAKLY